MNLRCRIVLGSVLCAVSVCAVAATFRAEVQGDTVVIYSTAKRMEQCSASVMYSLSLIHI